MNIRAPRQALLAMVLLALLPAAVAVADDGDAIGMLGTVDGEQIYVQICQGCHMPEGRGAQGGGTYPAFDGKPAMASAHYMALTVIVGRRNMPAFSRSRVTDGIFFESTWLTDGQIADVVNYIRSHFGNEYTDTITAADVRALQP